MSTARRWRSGDGDARCQVCGQLNPVWMTDNLTWNYVMNDEREAILCMACFIKRAEEALPGLRGAWQLYPPPRNPEIPLPGPRLAAAGTICE